MTKELEGGCLPKALVLYSCEIFESNLIVNMTLLSWGWIFNSVRAADSFGFVAGFDGLSASLLSSFFALAASANDADLPLANAPKPEDGDGVLNAEKALPELGGVFVGVVDEPKEVEPKVDFPKTGPAPNELGDPNVGVVEPGFGDDADAPLPPGPNAEVDPKALTVVGLGFANGEDAGVVLPNAPKPPAGLKGED